MAMTEPRTIAAPVFVRWIAAWLIATLIAHGLVLSVHRVGHAHQSFAGIAMPSGDPAYGVDSGSGGPAGQHDTSFCAVCSVLGFLDQAVVAPAPSIPVAQATGVGFPPLPSADRRTSALLPFPRGPPEEA